MDIREASRLTEASVRELETLLETLFANPVIIPGTARLAEIPVIGEPGYIVGLMEPSQFLPSICKALVAKEKFRMECPDWPDLPLRRKDCDELINCDCIKCNVTGYYGDSLRGEDWSPRHPGFGDYVGGLMFCRDTPTEIRCNPELFRQFPPVKLAGIADGRLDWRSLERLAHDRKMQRLCAEHDAAEAAEGLIGP